MASDLLEIVSPELNTLLMTDLPLNIIHIYNQISPEAIDQKVRQHHPRVEIFWNYFPFTLVYGPIERFFLNIGVWPLWLIT